jgi:hypothetical protein
LKSWIHPKLRIVVFLGAANAAWLTSAWLWLEHDAWLWITPIALSINFLLLTYDQVLSFTRLETRPLIGQDPWGLLKIVHELSVKFNSPRPEVFLLALPSAQVFCYAKTGRRPRLFITEGAIKLLDRRELTAVLTFQVGVMNSSLSVLNYWLAATLDLFFRAGRALEKAFSFVIGWAPPLSAWFVSPWAWLLQHALMSGADFRRLDRETALKIDHPEDLARALWKMESYAQTRPWSESWVFAHMCMVRPSRLGIQPPLKSRIKDLAGRYPL